ncbi:LytTR family DNA-binding domain-containing protein [Virgibacillus senegalensis]|uniref:LytTR family DNA-binding domain-containing protein n=1 Tax=Virgibacillus senegalensis TaxID=1499679 RepID=UPI00069DED77|nr:LytTR family DNA-binding domain-containing protein [Virgibacillus senegalensis]
MKVLLDVDRSHQETTVTIQCREIDDSIKQVLDFLENRDAEFIIGKNGEKQHILKPEEVHRFQAEGDSVMAITSRGNFKVKEKLYELDQILPPSKFIRISKSAIANLFEINHFEPSFNGTICVHFKSGAKEYVSRHYVSNIKSILKRNRRGKN